MFMFVCFFYLVHSFLIFCHVQGVGVVGLAHLFGVKNFLLQTLALEREEDSDTKTNDCNN